MTHYVFYHCDLGNGESVVIKSAPGERFATHYLGLVSTKAFKKSEFADAYESVPLYFVSLKIDEYVELMEAFLKRGYTTLRGENIRDIIAWCKDLSKRIHGHLLSDNAPQLA